MCSLVAVNDFPAGNLMSMSLKMRPTKKLKDMTTTMNLLLYTNKQTSKSKSLKVIHAMPPQHLS